MTTLKSGSEGDVTKLLEEHPALVLGENGRVRCSLTNHELPCRACAIQQHVNGKRYKRMASVVKQQFSYDQHKPHLVPSIKKGHENQLFCTLTLRHVNKLPDHVTRHVTGKRFLKAKKRWELCQQTGEKFLPTPQINRSHKTSDDKNMDVDGVENGRDSDADSLSDLYPEKYFDKLNLSDGESGGKPESGTTQAAADKKPKKKKKKTKSNGGSHGNQQQQQKRKMPATEKSRPAVKRTKKNSGGDAGKSVNGCIVFE